MKSLEEVKILKEEVEVEVVVKSLEVVVVVKTLEEEVVVEVAATRARTWRWRPCVCSTGGSD